MAKHLWNTLAKHASDYVTKRKRRNTVEGISTNTFGSEQQLPIDTQNFFGQLVEIK